MWLILPKKGFLSIVDASDEPGTLLVRARREGDIEAVFPAAKVVESPGRDYLYRVAIPRGDVAAVLAAAVLDLDYPNVKGACDDPALHGAMAECWYVLAELQEIPPYQTKPRKGFQAHPVRRTAAK